MEALSLAIFAVLALLAWFTFRTDGGWYWVLRRRLSLSDRVLREDALKYFAQCALDEVPGSLRGAAGSLGVDGGEITRIISQLTDRGLLETMDGGFRLTADGRRYGLRIIRAHRLYETYMSEKTGFDGDEWHERAEEAEHALTEDDLLSLDQSLAYPVRDPHGDPIPGADGSFVQPEGLIDLNEATAGSRAVIAHLEDEPAAVFRQITAAGLYPGQEIEIRAVDATSVRFVAENGAHELPQLAALNVQIVPSEKPTDDLSLGPIPTLADAPAGALRRIRELSRRISGTERRRLMDLGFLPGTEVVKEFASAAGDPIAIQVRGTLIALRRDQAANIIVDTITGAES